MHGGIQIDDSGWRAFNKGRKKLVVVFDNHLMEPLAALRLKLSLHC